MHERKGTQSCDYFLSLSNERLVYSPSIQISLQTEELIKREGNLPIPEFRFQG